MKDTQHFLLHAIVPGTEVCSYADPPASAQLGLGNIEVIILDTGSSYERRHKKLCLFHFVIKIRLKHIESLAMFLHFSHTQAFLAMPSWLLRPRSALRPMQHAHGSLAHRHGVL